MPAQPRRFKFALAAMMPIAVAPVVASAAATFTLDQPNSFLTIGGTVAGGNISPQGPGSLSSTYSGTVDLNLGSSTIEFAGGEADATLTGNWQPLAGGMSGTAPADYGGRFPVLIIFTAFFALRDMALTGASAPLTLDSAGAFDGTGVNFSVTRGSIDYNAAALSQMGSATLTGASGANQSTSPSSLTITRVTGGADGVLFVPAQGAFTVTDPTIGTATLTFGGQVRATANTINGDANFDRIVNIADFSVLAANFNQPGTWLGGDFDGNGTTAIGDFSLLASNFNQVAPAARAAVPEPTALIAAPLLAAWFARRRRA